MKLYSHIDKTILAKVRNKDYPVTVAGKGIPCLVIGLGSLMQRTLSPRFKESFEVYSSDLYWDRRFKLEEPTSLTMEQIIEDIALLAESLKLHCYVLMGHSAFGIVALEYARLYPSQLKGIIMIGTPLNSNPEIAAINNRYFEAHADGERKKIDAERRAQYAKEDQQKHLDEESRFLQEYIWRDAPRYWHDPTFDCTPLWKESPIDGELFDHFFSALLPKHNAQRELENIKTPIFLAAGMSDYDCCPWMWSEVKNPPPNLIVSRFEKSGHYPHYEEDDLFDERIEAWSKEL